MVKHRKLKGESSKGFYRVQTADGAPAEPSSVVFPLLRQEPSGDFQLLGTGFFIAENGLFVTAKHVITAVLDSDGIPRQPLVILQFADGGVYYQRPVHRCTHHPVSDVVVGVAWPMHHKTNGCPLPNKLLTVAADPPVIDSIVSTYAYPKTTIIHGRPQKIYLEPTFFEGRLVEYFPDGRDRIFLPGPCYRTSMVIHGGASGGPVVGLSGTVFGVNSTGFENDDVSFVSPISEIMDLRIPQIVMPGSPEPRTVTVRELKERGFVPSG